MDTRDFRKWAHEMADWMADYLETVDSRPVRVPVEPGSIAARLPASPPEQGEEMGRIFADFRDTIVPGMVHWQHPAFFGYFPANSSPPSVLAEMLTATLGAQCMSWATSPAATELETRVMDWLRQLVGLPEPFTGCIQDTASTATLCALLTARERATEYRSNAHGLSGAPEFTAYCSTETHSSIEKDVGVAGIGRENLRKVAVDANYAMRADALAEAIEADVAAGRRPLCVVATLGTTGSGGVDPLPEIAAVCRRHGLWLHVDAAWAGSALVLPEHRWMIAGVEHADSFLFNPHKWLFTNFDCTAYFVRDPGALARTFALTPEYLKTAEGERVVNYRDWGIQLGRRFRALKLWFVLRSYGIDGLRAKIAGHIEATRNLAESIAASDEFELVSDSGLALLCFRYRPPGVSEGDLDRLNERLLSALNDSGRLFLTHTRLDGRYVIRWSVGQTATERRHVEAAWVFVQATAREMGAEP